MNILLINKSYHTKGGVERHMLDLQRLLEQNGHNVLIFATRDKNTISSQFTKYFPKYRDYSKNASLWSNIISFSSFFVNFEAVKKLKKLIKENKIDIAHIHNIYHHLSPAILKVLKNNNIPVVMTLHDYKLICPNYSLFDFQKNKTCEKCKNGNYFNCYKNSCIQNSRAKSLVATFEMYFQQRFFPYSKLIDVFIAPSNFIKNKFLEFNFPNKNIEQIYNFTQIDNDLIGQTDTTKDYFLFFGRLSKEKGLKEFIEILTNLKKDFKFFIAGSGPEESNLKNLVKNLNLENKIKFLGFFGNDKQNQLNILIKEAQFIVVPSLWYENCSLSILESMAKAKLVLATRTGGNSELIIDNKTGILFDIKNPKEAIDKLTKILYSTKLIKEISNNARGVIKQEFNSDIYYSKIIDIYSNLINKHLKADS